MRNVGSAADNAIAKNDNTAVPTDNSATTVDGVSIGQDTLAVVNGENVTLAEYEAYLDLFVLKEQRNRDRLRKALLGLINNRLLGREAKREGIDQYATVSGKIAIAVSRVWKNAYWKEVVKPTVKITDEEILRKSPDFSDSVHLFQILVSTPTKAESLRRKLLENEDTFENIAKSESEGFSASKGGDSGYVSRIPSSIYDNTALEAIFLLKPGETSPVIHTPIGYAIFKVTEIKTATRQRKEWLEGFRQQAIGDKGKEVWAQHVLDLKKKHGIVVHDENGKRLVTAMENKEDLAKYKDMVLIEVDGKKWTTEDLIDPSGAGVVHGPGTFQVLIESRLREYLVNADMERRDLKKKYPALLKKEQLLEEDTLAREMLQRSVRDIQVTDKDIEDYYMKNKGKFQSPRMVNVSVIEVGSKEKAGEVYADLIAGKSFEESADRFSMNKKLKGGNLGWIQDTTIAPQFSSVRKLKAGEFNRAAVELKNPKTREITYVIMRVNDIRPGGILPLAKINRRNVELAVSAAKREAAIGKLLEKVRGENSVSIRKNAEDLIARFASRPRRGGEHGEKMH